MKKLILLALLVPLHAGPPLPPVPGSTLPQQQPETATATVTVPHNKPMMFYRAVPMREAATNAATNLVMAATMSTNDTATTAAVTIGTINEPTLTTNWTDHGTADMPAQPTTLAVLGTGIEYGIIVTNRVVTVLENGTLTEFTKHDTNTTVFLTREFYFERVYAPAKLQYRRSAQHR